MKVYRCKRCQFMYKEELEGKCFDELGEEFKCPRCSCSKGMFELIQDS